MPNNLFPSFPPSIPNFQPVGPTSLVGGSQYVQIPNLEIVVGLDGTEQLETVQYGQSKRVTTDQIRVYVFDNIPIIPTLIVNNLIAIDSIADQALLSTGVVWADLGGVLRTSSNFTFSSNTLFVPQVVSSFTGPIGNFVPNTGIFTTVMSGYVNIVNPSPIGPGVAKVMDLSFMGALGSISVNVPLSLPNSYNFNLPIDAGISGRPLLSGGGGATPMFYGSISGNTTTFGTTAGSFVAGNILTTDTFGNIVDTGLLPPVNPGLMNELAWYATTGSVVSGLPTANNGVLVTSPTGVPSIGFTLPLNVQTNITQLGTITVGVWNASIIPTPFGGTGLSSGTSGGILYFDTTTSMMSSALLSLDDPVLGGGAGGSPFSGSRSGNTTTFATTFGSFVPGNLVTSDVSGNIIDSGTTPSTINPGLINELAWYAATGTVLSGLPTANDGVLVTDGSGVPSISSTLPMAVQGNITALGAVTSGTIDDVVIGSTIPATATFFSPTFINSAFVRALRPPLPVPLNTLILGSSGASQEITFSLPYTLPSSYVWYMPTTAGTAGQVLTSQAGTNPMTWTTPGSGTVNPGTAGQYTYYASTGDAVSGLSSLANAVAITDGSGNALLSVTLPTDVQGNITALGAVFSGTIDNVVIGGVIPATATFLSPLFENTATVQGFRPPISQPISTLILGSSGAAETITFHIPYTLPSSYVWYMPTTEGTAGQVLTSQGGTNPMTWTTPTSGSVNPGTSGQYSYYASTGSTISGLSTLNNGVAITDGSGNALISNTLPTVVQGNITGLGAVTSGTIDNVVIGGTTPAVGSFTTLNASTAINATYMNEGSVVFVDIIDHKLNTDTGFTYNSGPQELTVPTINLSTIIINSGAGIGHGTVTLIAPDTTFTSYETAFPINPGSAGQPLLSGGGGSTPMTWGALQGNGAAFATATGAFTPGNFVTTNAAGALVDSGLLPGSGTVSPGTINDLAWYSSSGSTVSPLATANNGILATNGSGVPSISTTLPFTVPVTTGGTGHTTFTTNGVVYGNGTSPLLVTAQGGSNTVLAANNGAPSFTSGPSLSSVNLVGAVAGTVTLIAPSTSFTSYSFNFPTSAGSSGQPLLSGGGGGTPQTYGTLGVGGGGSGVTTFTANGVLYGNGASPILATAQGVANSVLTANAGAPSFSAAPVIGVSVTTPQIFGGSAAASQLTIAATSSGAASGDKVSIAAGLSIKLTVDDGGVFVSKGVPPATATSQLQIAGGGPAPGGSQIKFSNMAALLTTPESGAIEYSSPVLYLTNDGIRRNIMVGSVAAIPATTLTTVAANFATINIASGENYIVEIDIPFIVSANTVIIGFNGASVNTNDLSLLMRTNNILTPSVYTNVAANSGTNTTAPGSMVQLRITGLITATATATFGIHLATSAGTVNFLAGAYYKYVQF